MNLDSDPKFWNKKRVFLTGHTGFKGSWLSLWLASMGAEVTGYALAPQTDQKLYDVLGVNQLIKESFIGNICDLQNLRKVMLYAKPEIIIHMAAQSLVRYSFANPIETYQTNIMGTVNILECTRELDSVRATLVVTSDKCYENREWTWGYRENEPMGGSDPYSSSKGCAELVTSAYRQSFFNGAKSHNQIASARAGNVIGGGDWSKDRLIPDAIRALEANEPLIIRNPYATRPWQHVLEPLSGYLILCQALFNYGEKFASGWNFGPRDEDSRTVEEVVNLLISSWGGGVNWRLDVAEQPHEAKLLKLDCSKTHSKLGWTPKWTLETAVQKIIDWQKCIQKNDNMQEVCLTQINQYLNSK